MASYLLVESPFLRFRSAMERASGLIAFEQQMLSNPLEADRSFLKTTLGIT